MNHKLSSVTCTLLLLSLLGTSLWKQPAVIQAQSSLPPLGFHVSTGDSDHMQAAKNAGASFVVVVFEWDNIEPVSGYFYWEKPDAALRAAEYYGLTVIARLDRPPDWAMEPDTPTPWDLDAYNNFVAKVAQRYGAQLDAVIIWNEPNLAIEWNNQPPVAADYATMLRGANETMKAFAPDLPVLMAGPSMTEGDGVNAVNDLAYLHALYDAGIANHFDILAAHPYGFGQPPAQAPSAEKLNFRRLELQRQVMVDRGDADKPIWITEAGWRTSSLTAADAWQVVTAGEQANYSLDAVDYAASNYPWLQRFGFWDLNSGNDIYGYTLWQSTAQYTVAYKRLAERYAKPAAIALAKSQPVEILADDTIIRLGEIGTIHPHWVHLHRGGNRPSPTWAGEFFLHKTESTQPFELWLETMQIDQPSNRVRINGTALPYLQARTRPDPTSTWVTQRLPIQLDLLTEGRNEIEIQAGLRKAASQYANWRLENFQFRNVRLVPQQSQSTPRYTATSMQSPGSWADINRLRAGLLDHGGMATFWATGSERGQIWQGLQAAGANGTIDNVSMSSVAHNRTDLRFIDVAVAKNGALAATDQGIFWLENGTEEWKAVAGAPAEHANVIMQKGTRWLAGFENQGLWSAYRPQGPWRHVVLDEIGNKIEPEKAAQPQPITILDIAIGRDGKSWISTNRGLYQQTWRRIQQISGPPAQSDEAPDKPLLVDRLTTDLQGRLVVRHNDNFWRRDGEDSWHPLTPESLADSTRTIVPLSSEIAIWGTRNRGVWAQSISGQSISGQSTSRPTDDQPQRIDPQTLEWLTVTDGLLTQHGLYMATTNGLLYTERSCLPATYTVKVETGAGTAREPCVWQTATGLPKTATDILIDPSNSQRWIVSTPAGIHRSLDAGQTWSAISSPWVVWDMALGPAGRLYIARADGMTWTDDFSTPTVTWGEADGMESVLFFRVNPSPTDPNILWAGTWGNNIAASTDGGATIAPIHNGLETLSVLDILWHQQPGQLTIATIEGLYRSDDGGTSWFKLPGPLKQQTVYALHQRADGAIWAGAADGLWVSRDWGTEWTIATGLPAVTVLRVGELMHKGKALLWVGTESGGLWVSDDGGNNWIFAALAGRTVYEMATDSAGGLIAATDRGLYWLSTE